MFPASSVHFDFTFSPASLPSTAEVLCSGEPCWALERRTSHSSRPPPKLTAWPGSARAFNTTTIEATQHSDTCGAWFRAAVSPSTRSIVIRGVGSPPMRSRPPQEFVSGQLRDRPLQAAPGRPCIAAEEMMRYVICDLNSQMCVHVPVKPSMTLEAWLPSVRLKVACEVYAHHQVLHFHASENPCLASFRPLGYRSISVI